MYKRNWKSFGGVQENVEFKWKEIIAEFSQNVSHMRLSFHDYSNQLSFSFHF